jgi:hypothetical protein
MGNIKILGGKMSYSESEIPEKLEEGKIYKGKQIKIFLIENPNIIIISENDLNILDNKNYRIEEIKKGYIHDQKDRVYQIPSIEKTIYIIN